MLFTISIPTYNRRPLLERNLINLEKIRFDNDEFEVIIVDDGSTDDTESFVSEYLHNTNLNIHYHKQENQGKYMALRHAIIHAQGKYFINCDSDDYLLEDSLERLHTIFNSNIFRDENLAGIIGHNLNIKKNQLLGDKFPENLISNPIEVRFKFKVGGDKFPCFITRILKQNNFENFTGKTKFVPESYLFYKISNKYNFLYVNEVFQAYDYQESGLTSQIHSYRIKNAYGCFKVYELFVKIHSKRWGSVAYVRNYINYRRFGYHIGEKILAKNILDFILGLSGYLIYMKER